MPIYEFECGECGARFEELVAAGAADIVCAECGSAQTRRLMSSVSPPGRQPRGAPVRSGESRRREREAARVDRIAESRKKRAAGENPHPPKKKDGK
ncbi:MAG TPA: zinc ribbon domain-containing protein [Solirubrobacterales bacterium]|nr:zinc ribbon domain-containing protein [Solirubrobacterales bacterium]